MLMTEKQGGSDLRANSTVAQPVGDGWYELTGHKWFCTHPVFAMFFTLAVTKAGITGALDSAEPEWLARRVVERIALALQGSLLVRHAPPEVADAFCARLADGRRAFGTLPAGVDAQAIIDRVLTA